MTDVVRTLDPVLKKGIDLSAKETDDLVAFLSDGLYDKRITTDLLKSIIPASVPSDMKLQYFEFTNVNVAPAAQHNGQEKIQNDVQLTVYPNPVADILYVKRQGNIPIGKIEVTDASGRVRLSKKLNAEQEIITINVQGLQQGIYFLRVTDKAGRTDQK